jgi:DNA-binding NarL/FixJ family response regulator
MNEQIYEFDRRAAAIAAERESRDQVPLARVWLELKSGQARIVDGFITEERCYLVLTAPRAYENPCPPKGRRLFILEGVLCGQSLKTLAFDLCVSPSTVSNEAKLALQQLGLQCTPCKANPLLAVLARAAAQEQLNRCARVGYFSDENRAFRVIATARPEARLAPVLSPAEFAVVRGLLEGRNYLEIAKKRGTSTRTVANQIAAAFRRLGVSGRGSLLNHVVSSPEVFA